MSLYQTLGLTALCSQDEIRRAYKLLAQRNHPDRHPDDPDAAERFLKIKEAYDVLSDPERRERYDQTGDTEAPSSVEQQAVSMMLTTFLQIADANNWADMPYAAKVKQQLGNHRSKIKDELRKATSMLERVKALVLPKHEGEIDLLASAVQQRLDAIKHNVEEGQAALETVERAIEIAGEYSDVVEAQQFIGFANTTATGSSTF